MTRFVSRTTPGGPRMWAAVICALFLSLTTSATAAERITLAQLPDLARDGKFDKVLDALKADKHAKKDALATALVADLERYQANKKLRDAKRHEQLAEAEKKMREAREADKLHEAVVHAVEAHGLADDGDEYREQKEIADLVTKAQEEAKEAEKSGNWLDANALYRALNLLYDDNARFRDDLRRIERRLRVLRIYVPKELQRLHEERSKRLGDEDAEPLQLGNETWRDRLKGVTFPMMRTAVRLSKKSHVSNPAYPKLMLGGFTALRTMIDTDGVGAAFPALKNADAVSNFKQGLAGLIKEVNTKGKDMGWLDASHLMNRLETLNTETVKLPESVIVYEFTDGALGSLDDFTAVIWPRDKEQFSRNTQGKFYGVGIQISRRDGQLVVVSPLANTPAMKAGVKAGDIIAKVNGTPTADWTLDKAVREITGPEGTDVTLGMQRAGQQKLLEFKITRAEIPIESIRGWSHTPDGRWDYVIDKKAKIGYVRLSQFIPQSAEDLDAAIAHMREELGSDINGLVIDLRFNPGGLLSSAIDISDRFIRHGPIVSTVAGSGTRTGQATAKADKTYDDYNVAVLINQGSASASEIVSGALQDYNRALIVGERSFGKGSVQDLYILERDAYLKLTTQYYKLPKDRIIHREPYDTEWGIEPNLKVKVTAQQVADLLEVRQAADVLRGKNEPPLEPDEAKKADPAEILKQSLDPQLEAALLVLKTRQVVGHLAIVKSGESARKE